MSKKRQCKSLGRRASLTIPELEQSKAAVLNTLASVHSRKSYQYAIERFIAWYCDTPRLAFNRSVVVQYRSFLESLACQPLRSTFIFPRSGDWPMSLLRADGSALNWRLESGELRESSGSERKWATGLPAIRLKS